MTANTGALEPQRPDDELAIGAGAGVLVVVQGRGVDAAGHHDHHRFRHYCLRNFHGGEGHEQHEAEERGRGRRRAADPASAATA